MKSDHNLVLTYKNEFLTRPTKASAVRWVSDIHVRNENAWISVWAWGIGRRPASSAEMNAILAEVGLTYHDNKGVVVL